MHILLLNLLLTLIVSSQHGQAVTGPPEARQSTAQKVTGIFPVAQALQGWKDYRKKLERVSGSWTEHPNANLSIRYSTKVSHPLRLTFIENVQSKSTVPTPSSKELELPPHVKPGGNTHDESTDLPTCVLINNRYSAFLFRENEKWSLAGVHPLQKPWAEYAKRRIDEDQRRLETLILVHDSWSLPDLASDPSFQILATETIREGSEELIGLRFKAKAESVQQLTAAVMTSGRLVFDPRQSWCLRSAEVETNDDIFGKYLYSTVWTIKPGKDGVPLPVQRKTQTTIIRGGNTVHTSEALVDYQLEFPKTPFEDKEFTLAAFGLNEPHEEQLQQSGKAEQDPNSAGHSQSIESRSYLWLWLTGFGLLGVLVIISVIRWRLLQLKRTFSWDVKAAT